MKESRFTDGQKIAILEEANRGELTVNEFCRKDGIHKQTYYGWGKRYGGLDEADLQRLKRWSKRTRGSSEL